VCLATEGVLLLRAGRNLGFGGGNDAGIGVSSAPLLCLLNPDTVVAPGQLTRLVEVARAQPGAIVAPGFVHPDGSLQELGQRLLADATTVPVLDRGAPADYASAACWVLHRDVYATLGGFDPVFHPAYYEDVDFVLRARRAGHDLVVVDDVLVVHEQRGSTTSAPATLPDVSRQRAAFAERWADVLHSRATTAET
jgi:GT2 family glycosyltransferase